MERAWLSQKPLLQGHLLDLEVAHTMTLDMPFRRRPLMRWRLVEDGDVLHLHFHGKRLQLPGYVAPDLLFMGTSDEAFTGLDLPGELDDAGRVVLVQRLLREGFLTAAPAGATVNGHAMSGTRSAN
jgi:hypothetical protein